ncbi:MAG: PqqD family protein [Bradyrhizobium sp.]
MVTLYKRRSRVMTQRIIALAGYKTIDAALRDPAFDLPTTETALAISYRGKMFHGNLVAGLVWDSLEKARSASCLARIVMERFHIDEGTALHDVSALLEVLKNHDLLEEVAES